MSSQQLTLSVLRRVRAVSRLRSQFILRVRSCYSTSTQTGFNYYDIFDKRNLTESPGFEKNDPRSSWTNRDESTSDDYIDFPEESRIPQRSVCVYRKSTISNRVSKVDVPLNSMEGDDVVSGITYNILGIEGNGDLEELYFQLGKMNMDKYVKSLQNSKEKMELLEDLQVQFEKLLHQRKLKMDQIVKGLLVIDRLDILPHELRNVIQSTMMLNIHKFTPFQIITVFEVYDKERARYQRFLNLLCLMFYDQMIPYIKKRPGYEKAVELKHVLQFIKVLKDFKFKRLTDVLYAQVYDNLGDLKVEEMVEVSNTFFENKRDKNFVEMYTKILSVVFQMPLLDISNFENYAQRKISENEVELMDNRNSQTLEDGLLQDVSALRSIFNCSSEFLMSSVHHRIEFKRLWRSNIKNNNVNWKVQKEEEEEEKEQHQKELEKLEARDKKEIDRLEEKLDSDIRVRDSVSYSENFGELYEKMEKTILKLFKFENYREDFLVNLIETVLDYSRYANSANTGNIVSNLYAMLINTPKEGGKEVKNLTKLSPRTIMDHSQVYFYKIDDNCEFFKSDRINYYKPDLATHSLLKGDGSLYSLLLEVFRSYISGMDPGNRKEEGLGMCRLIRNLVHPFYCLRRSERKKFLSLDLMHMRGSLKDKSLDELSNTSANSREIVERLLEGRLKGEVEKFSEKAKEYILKMTEKLEDDLRLEEGVEVLRTLSSLKVCNGGLEEGEWLKEYASSTVGKLFEYFRTSDSKWFTLTSSEEDVEDGVRVGGDLKLFDLVTDLLDLEPSEKIYELLRETLKTVYARMKYYSIPELVMLSSCILCSQSHLEKLDLESEELLENLHQTVRILKQETISQFELKSAGEEYFNEETRKIYNFMMSYHSF